MKPKFWLERWQNNQIGFHQTEHNPLLQEFWHHLCLPTDAAVFVPLCGKSLDMHWLAAQGHSVVGVELAQLAVEQFFAEEKLVTQQVVDRFIQFSNGQTSVFLGDFFDLTSELVGNTEGVFDRGGLVALPPDMRFRYVDHMLRIIPEGARILLLTLEYDQSLVDGPPHSVEQAEVERLYGQRCEIALLDAYVTATLPPHFQAQNITQAVESVYLITKKD